MDKGQAIGIVILIMVVGVIALMAVILSNWAQGKPLFSMATATDPVKGLGSQMQMAGKPWASKVTQVNGHMDEITDTGFSLLHGRDCVIINGSPEEPIKIRRKDSGAISSDKTLTLKSPYRLENTEVSGNNDIRVDFL